MRSSSAVWIAASFLRSSLAAFAVGLFALRCLIISTYPIERARGIGFA